MSASCRAIVIGGGIVGCSVLYHLARRGWSDVLLLEKRGLTSGSTWHAAGNVTHFGHDARLTRLYADSIATYRQAEKASGQSVGFRRTGSLRLARDAHELAAYRKLAATYAAMGINYHTLNADQAREAFPLLAGDFAGAAHTPDDGHVDSVGATHALAKAARQAGAAIQTRAPVTGIKRAGDAWRVTTGGENGAEMRARHVVLAAGFWSRELAQPLGLNLPLYALEHHEIITDAVAELKALGREAPTVRDPAAPANVRQEGEGFLCGVYEAAPKLWAVDGIPPDFGEELLAPDMERLQPHLLKVMARIPAFAGAGIKAVNNGPICYTPDGCPLVGPVRGRPGLWLAAGFPAGIGAGGGAGRFLAEWVTQGAPTHDLPLLHPARFPNDMQKSRCLNMIRKVYAEGYATP